MSQEKLSTQIEVALSEGNYPLAKELLQKACNAYYITGKSDLTDDEFNELQKIYIDFSGDTDFFNNKITKEAIKASRMREAVINFPNMCCWLNKAESTEAAFAWLKNIAKILKKKSIEVFATPKYDGFSISIEYDFKGNPIYAVTRGDGDIGMDYTHFFDADPAHFSASTVQNVMQEFNITNALKFIVKYEACITQENLDLINEIRVAEGDEPYKNRRNAVPGIFRQTGGLRFRKYISLMPIDIDFENNDLLNVLSKDDRNHLLSMLLDENCSIVDPKVFHKEYWEFIFEKFNPKDEEDMLNTLNVMYRYFTTLREDSPYMMDGIVIELNDPADVKTLGGFTETPSHVLGWKFDVIILNTVVTDCVFDYGRSGRRTPVVHFEPVNIYGNTYTKSSISNMLRFDEMKLAVGTPVKFSLRGDVLGYIERAGNDPVGAVPFDVPDDVISYTYRPNKDTGEDERVFAYSVPLIGGELERFFVNTGVQGIKSGTIEILEQGLLKKGIILSSIDEFFSVMAEVDFVDFENFGQKKDKELRDAIRNKNEKGWEAWEIIAGLNIQQIGISIAKSFMTNLEASLAQIASHLVNNITTDDEYADFSYDIYSKLKGKELLGETRIQRIIDGIYVNEPVITKLYELLNVKDTKAVAPINGDTLTIVVTGAMKYFPDRDRDFKPILESLGHKLVNGISGNTNYLVTNTPKSGTKKNQQAQARNIPIVTEEEIMKILGIPVPETNVKLTTSHEADDLDSFID